MEQRRRKNNQKNTLTKDNIKLIRILCYQIHGVLGGNTFGSFR